jgi:hypothetical protein
MKFIYYNAFYESCINGHLNVAKWLHIINDNLFDLHYGNEMIFSTTCIHNQIEVAKWLYSIGCRINKDNKYTIFCSTAGNGQIETAKWLISLDKNIFCDLYESAFYSACIFGNLKGAKWIYSLDNTIIKKFNENDKLNLFVKSCINWQNNFDVPKWLISLDDIDCSSYYEEAFRQACLYGKIDAAKWLYSLNNTIDIYYNLHKIIINIKKWLITLSSNKYNLRSNKRKREE